MSEPTPAQDYASFLRAVADHLDAHPELEEPWPWITPGRSLQVPTSGGSRRYVAWCRSLGVRDLRVKLFDNDAHVHAWNVPLGETTVRDLWAGVEGLQRLLVEGGGYGGVPFTLTELEYFAEHGTLPEAGTR